MADVQVLHAQAVNVSTTAPHNTPQQIVNIPGSSFTGGAKYLLIANTSVAHGSSAEDIIVRFRNAGNIFNLAAGRFEVLATTQYTNIPFLYVFTQPSTPVDIDLVMASSGAFQVTAAFASIIAINLDDVGTQNTDYYHAASTTTPTTTASFANHTSFVLSASGSDDWLVIGQGRVTGVNATSSYGMRLNDNVAGALVTVDIEGEDPTNEIRSHMLMAVYRPASGNHTVALQYKHESVAHTLERSFLAAIKLSTFAQYEFSRTAGSYNLSSTGFETFETLSPSPATTGDWVIMGYLSNDVGSSSNNEMNVRLQIDPDGAGLVSDPNYGDDGPRMDGWDNLDIVPYNIMTVRSLTSGGEREINWDAWEPVFTNQQAVLERTLVAFSVAKPSTGLTVNANVGSLTITGNQASIVPGAATVQASPGSMSAVGNQATIIPGAATVSVQAGLLTIDGLTAAVVAGAATIQAQAGLLTIAGNQATVVTGAVSIQAQVGELTVVGLTATVVPGAATVVATPGQIIITGNEASIIPGTATILADPGELLITGLQATIDVGGLLPINIAVNSGVMTVTGLSVTVIPGAAVIPTTSGDLVLTGLSATVEIGTSIIPVSAGVMTIEGLSATVVVGDAIIGAQPGEMTISGLTADVLPGATTITATEGTLVTTGLTATITSVTAVQVQAGVLTIAGQQASLLTGPATIAAATGVLTISGFKSNIISGIIIVPTAERTLVVRSLPDIKSVRELENTGTIALLDEDIQVSDGRRRVANVPKLDRSELVPEADGGILISVGRQRVAAVPRLDDEEVVP